MVSVVLRCSIDIDDIDHDNHHFCSTADSGSKRDHPTVYAADHRRNAVDDIGCGNIYLDWIRRFHLEGRSGELHDEEARGDSLRSSIE